MKKSIFSEFVSLNEKPLEAFSGGRNTWQQNVSQSLGTLY